MRRDIESIDVTTNDADRLEWLASTVLQGAEAAGIGVMVTTAGQGLENVFANGAAGRMFGLDAAEILQIDPLSLFMGEERDRLEELAAAFLADGTFPHTIETTAERRDGTRVFLELGLGGVTIGDRPSVVAFIADVTQRRLAVDSLRKSEERFRSVVERLPEAIFITQGTAITYANPSFVQLLGRDAKGEGGLSVTDLTDPADTRRLIEQIESLTDGTVTHAEYRMTSIDGRSLTLEISAIGADLDGQPTMLWLGQDVTERRELEGQILQSDRLAVLGTLALGMAHAINNPLSYTLLNLEHVSRRMQSLAVDPEYHAEARVRLAEAHDGADRVAKVVRQMRALARARPVAPGPVDIRAVLESVLAMVGHEIRYRGQLVTRYDAAPRVWASEGELEQAFLGLLLHVARLRPEEPSPGREIRVSLGTDLDGRAFVTVSDDGPALDPEVRARLLDPFSSVEPMGLGLVMCNAIFTALGGRMDIESDTSARTTFRVVLPASDAEVSVPSQGSTTIHPSPRSATPPARARVLVIDDDPGVASTLRAMLESDHEVTSVESAREGLRLLLGNQEFDVVFCDLVMPEVSGVDLYCALELHRPERAARIVFMTGAVFAPDAERFLGRVPNPRIEKPFSLARVEQLLAQAVRASGLTSTEP